MALINPKHILLKVAARALIVGLEEIPVVGGIIRVGRECWQALRDAQEQARDEERIVQLEQAAAITPEEARNIAQEVVMEMRNEGQSIDSARAEAVQDIVAVMPAQIHERTRATLSHARRLGTQAVAALPVTNRFSNAEREAFYSNLFPQRRPQFRSGDAIPHFTPEWKLDRLIGAGGFGEVWLARHQRMKSKAPMAIKFCQDEVSAKLLKKESATLNLLIEELPVGTPHLVGLLELNLTVMPYWLAYEYVEGGTLESRIRLGPMDWATAWSLFEPILQGMAMVHELNIVHRDLKPANILLDKNQQPRIADFGIGKLVATQAASTQQAQRSRSMTTRGYGSLGYMSPEQASGNEPAHTADDVYALGVILWQMLMGTVQQVPEFSDDIVDLAVSDTVKQVLTRCRFVRRNKRLQTAGALLAALEEEQRQQRAAEAQRAAELQRQQEQQEKQRREELERQQREEELKRQREEELKRQREEELERQRIISGRYRDNGDGTVSVSGLNQRGVRPGTQCFITVDNWDTIITEAKNLSIAEKNRLCNSINVTTYDVDIFKQYLTSLSNDMLKEDSLVKQLDKILFDAEYSLVSCGMGIHLMIDRHRKTLNSNRGVIITPEKYQECIDALVLILYSCENYSRKNKQMDIEVDVIPHILENFHYGIAFM